MKRLRVLVLHSELGVLRGGGENFTRNLFAVLAKRGYEISAAFVASPSGKYPVAMPVGIAPIPMCGWWARQPGRSALSFVARYAPSNTSPSPAFRRVTDSLEWRGARWHEERFHRRIRRQFAGRWQQFDAIYVHGSVQLAVEAARHRPTVLRLPGPVSIEQGRLLRAVPVTCANGRKTEAPRPLVNGNAA